MPQATKKLRLENRIALITGSGSGIGRAMALLFAQEGSDVIVADWNFETAQDTVDKIHQLDRKSFALKVDVSKADEVQKMVNKIYDTVERVDILVNNAGIFPTGDPVVKLSEEVFDQCISINLRGTFLCSKYLGQKMLRQKKMRESDLRGKIINISSMAGKEGFALSSVYCATKFAVLGLTQAMAKEVAPRMTVNAICPGIIRTPLWGRAEERLAELPPVMKVNIYMQRIGTPEDVTPLAVFLASSESDYITGQAFNVTGGIIFH
ncbi:MAG TPA: SDR family oxidoreductase [Candidatus Deferrimicrobium sp.]|nr:SDR family oxidoreductase [Candidatus Deferrimicrobium sp.]